MEPRTPVPDKNVVSLTAYRAAINRRYQERYPDRVREMRRKSNAKRTVEESAAYWKKYRTRDREKLFALFGSKCAKCGFGDCRAFQLDHINGAVEPRGARLRGGWPLYMEILRGNRDLGEFQLLCANCNAIKVWENREWGRYKIKKQPV